MVHCTELYDTHTWCSQALAPRLVSCRPLGVNGTGIYEQLHAGGIICSGELRPGGGRGVLREAREARDSPARGAYYSSCVVGAAVGFLASIVGTAVGLSSVVGTAVVGTAVGTPVGLHSVVGTAVGLASIVGTAVVVGTAVGARSLVGAAVGL